MTDDKDKQCSFCGMKKPEAKVLVEGQAGTICDGCATSIKHLIKMHPKKTMLHFPTVTDGDAA